jgi:MarR family 2-MHQ and catechol resistance regulon transcriptional repressor
MKRAPGTPNRTEVDANTLDRAASLRLLVVMSKALRAVTEPLRQHLKQWALTPTEFGLLEALYHKGPLPLKELAECVLITDASTTYAVKRLERRGLLQRRPCEEDRRFVFGELTDSGRELIRAAFPAHAERIRIAMRGLSRKEKVEAAELLKRLGLTAAAVMVHEHRGA